MWPLSTVTGFVSGQLWKLTTAAAVVVALGFAGWLVAVKIENGHLTRTNAALSDSINNPATGYIAKLAQAHTNVATLTGALADQNAKLTAKSAKDAAALAAAQKALTNAKASVAALQKRARATLAYKPVGETSCARTADVIKNYLEGLK